MKKRIVRSLPDINNHGRSISKLKTETNLDKRLDEKSKKRFKEYYNAEVKKILTNLIK